MNLHVHHHHDKGCSGGFLIGYVNIECLKCDGQAPKPICWSRPDRPMAIIDQKAPFNAGRVYDAMKRSENDRLTEKWSTVFA